MDIMVLKAVGQVAGIGGLSLGVFLLLFREIIRKNIFPRLPAAEAYKLLRLITGAVWSVAIVGILAWMFVGIGPWTKIVAGPNSVANGGNITNSVVSAGAAKEGTTPASEPPKQ